MVNVWEYMLYTNFMQFCTHEDTAIECTGRFSQINYTIFKL